MSGDGVSTVVTRGEESEFEWKIENFSLSTVYVSPNFNFESVSYYLNLDPNHTDGYIHLSLCASSSSSPIEVEFSVSLKDTEGRKRFERNDRKCFKDNFVVDCYEIKQWIRRSEFRNRQREFLSFTSGFPSLVWIPVLSSARSKDIFTPRSSGCLTIVLTMKRADSEESETASAATECFSCKENIHGDKISFHRKCFGEIVKCPQCDELVILQKWFDHEREGANLKASSAAAACSCCKGNIYGAKISFHKDCLNKETKCARCDEVVSLQNYFDHVCQMANVPAATSTNGSSVTCEHDKMLQDLKQLLLSQEQTDVILRVKGKDFPTHKSILAARSSVFASTFRHGMKENKTGVVDIEDCDPAVFPDFLRFLYSNDTDNLSSENVFGLFTVADKYDCQDLRAKCMHFIKENLTVETFCKALALALLHSEAELIHLATDFFIENAEKILLTVEWQTFAAENITYCNELFIKYVNSTKCSNS